MGKLVDELIKGVGECIKHHLDRIAKYQDLLPLQIEIARKLEDAGGFRVVILGSRFTFRADTNEESSAVVEKLLVLFPEVKKFEKRFVGGQGKPAWEWYGAIREGEQSTELVVENATPDENCNPKELIGVGTIAHLLTLCDRE